MEYVCPECGGRFTGVTCPEYFDTCQAREFGDPAYFAVHHLSVPSYLLQHNRYSWEGWLAARETLREFLEVAGPGQHRPPVRTRDAFTAGERTWSFTKGEKLTGVNTIRWNVTVAEVRLASPEQYCADVCSWAAGVIADSQAYVQALRTGGSGNEGDADS